MVKQLCQKKKIVISGSRLNSKQSIAKSQVKHLITLKIAAIFFVKTLWLSQIIQPFLLNDKNHSIRINGR